jgi:DNA repair exonuclease SbcCD ATPase subunit
VRRLEVCYQRAQDTFLSAKKARKTCRSKLSDATAAQEYIQTTAQLVQRNVHRRIADVVSRCLATVFEEPYRFRIHFERKRGRTEARLAFYRDGRELDPKSASGGGVIDVAAFALRLACLMLARPRRRKLLVLDEPLRHLSAEYLPRARQLLLALAKDFGVQIVMVTHQRGLNVGKVVEL